MAHACTPTVGSIVGSTDLSDVGMLVLAVGSLNRFWPLISVAEPSMRSTEVSMPLNDGKKKKKKMANDLDPSSKFLVSESLQGFNAHISEAINT
jgi:hypothetical protein